MPAAPLDTPPSIPSLPEFSPSTHTSSLESLNTARKKHEDRAKRFGVSYVEPKLEVVEKDTPKRYTNPRAAFAAGFSMDDEAEKEKRAMRAKKFAVLGEEGASSAEPSNPDPAPAEEQPQNDSMMDVDLREDRKDVGIQVKRRLDTIYLYGTDEMSTEDIFTYFKDFGAACVEWINDSSCNVIFLDMQTATRALQGLSKPLDEFNLQLTAGAGLISIEPNKPTNSEASEPQTTTSETNETSETAAKPDQTTTPVQATPEQIILYGWRKGKSVKGVPILMRYATVEDVKSKDNKPSAYYKKMLGDLRNKKGKKNRQHKRDDRDRNRNRNRNGNRDRQRNENAGAKGKRKLDDEGDIEMIDPVEQEKRKQRRKKFFPEESEEASSEPTNYIVSSTTVPALLQPSEGSLPTSTEPVQEASSERDRFYGVEVTERL